MVSEVSKSRCFPKWSFLSIQLFDHVADKGDQWSKKTEANGRYHLLCVDGLRQLMDNIAKSVLEIE